MSDRNYWMARAGAYRRRVNFARWFEAFSTPAFVVALGSAGVILVARGMGAARPDGLIPARVFGVELAWSPLTWAAVVTVPAFAVVATLAYRRASRRFESTPDALARLDDTLRLHSRLSSAHAGVGAWPVPAPAAVPAWRHGRASRLVAAGAAFLAVAMISPVGATDIFKPEPAPEAPPAIRDLRAWTKKLREDKVLDPRALDRLEKQAEELMAKPKDDWYSATQMEAAEHLRDRADGALRDLDKDLAAAKAVLDRVAADGAVMPEELVAQLGENLAEALEGLELSELPLSPEAREKLAGLSMDKLKPMSKQALDALRRELADKARKLRHARETGGKEGKGGKSAAQAGETFPVFAFAPGVPGPVEIMKVAVGKADSGAVATHLTEADESEREEIQAILKKKKPRPYLQSGCKAGMVAIGVVLLPDADGPTDDTLALEALEDMVYGEAFTVNGSAPHRAALVAALKAGRLRMAPFELKDGQCENGSCSNPGGAMALSMGLCAAGAGGPGGGGGPAPLTTGDKTVAEAKKTEELGGKDHSNDGLGDMKGLTSGKHKVDKNAYRGPAAGGAVSHEGDGSETVWTDNLTPEERELLKRYFK